MASSGILPPKKEIDGNPSHPFAAIRPWGFSPAGTKGWGSACDAYRPVAYPEGACPTPGARQPGVHKATIANSQTGGFGFWRCEPSPHFSGRGISKRSFLLLSVASIVTRGRTAKARPYGCHGMNRGGTIDANMNKRPRARWGFHASHRLAGSGSILISSGSRNRPPWR